MNDRPRIPEIKNAEAKMFQYAMYFARGCHLEIANPPKIKAKICAKIMKPVLRPDVDSRKRSQIFKNRNFFLLKVIFLG
jgi:hypothetical protein